jgi:hypothetical protein
MTDTTQLDTTITTDTTVPSIDFDTYLQAVPADLKELCIKNGVKDFDSQSKWVSNLNSLIGKKGLIKPAEDASEEDKKAYLNAIYKDLGVPETGEYEYGLPESIDAEKIDSAFIDDLASIAHENGVSNNAFNALINKIYGTYAEKLAEAQKNNSPEVLKETWGDKFEENFNLANNVFKKYMDLEGGEEFMNSPLAQNPTAIKFFYNIAKANKMASGKLDDGIDTISKTDLQSQAKALTQEAMQLRDSGKYNEASKKHQEALDLLSRIM